MSFGCALVDAIEAGCEVDRKEAAKLAQKIIEAGASNGDAEIRYYWPRRFMGLDSKARDEAIREEFNGRNLKEVCENFGVAASTVYRAIHRAA